jgi:integrating conjugative element protein (TIGR03759 family)
MNIKVLFVSLIFLSNAAFALDDIINTPVKNTVSQNTELLTSQVGTAKDWGLTISEWNQYLNLMQGPSGHYYKSLSPPEVMGIQAETMEELNHYAEVAAKLEHDKLERELRFNTAFHEAASKLYAAEPLIRPFDLTPFTPITQSSQ